MTTSLDAYVMTEERANQRPAVSEPTAHLVLNAPAQYKALGHPLRHRLLNVLRQRPATLGQLASALGSTKGTVGYHVNVLQEAGLLRPAETRTVRGGTEQYYAPVSGDLRHDPGDTEAGRFIVTAALAEMLPPQPGQPDLTVLRHLRLTPAQAQALVTRIEEFAHTRPEPDDAAAEPYGLLLSVYRADIPRLQPE